MNDQAFLNTPGELLAAARRRSGLDLPVLAERTKIPVHMLEAVERDEYHRISDPLYVKSFLRAYAVEVGEDPDRILETYGRMTGSSRSADAPEEVWEEQKVTIRRVGLPWNRILAWTGLVVVVAVVAFSLVRTLGGGGDDPAPSSPVAARDAAQTQDVAQTQEDAAPAPAETESDTEPVATEPASEPVAETTPPDSLARGWYAEAPREDPPPVVVATAQTESRTNTESGREPDDGGEAAAAAAPAREPEQEPVRVAEPEPETDPEPAPVTPPATSPAGEPLPEAAVGGAGLSLAPGQPRSQVLRIRTTVPVTVSVRRDGERSFTRYRLPGGVRNLPPLPAADIEAGKAYAVRNGVVAYWGARDHFDLVLDRVDGVEVSLNGVVRDLARVRPGDEMVLDAFMSPSGR